METRLKRLATPGSRITQICERLDFPPGPDHHDTQAVAMAEIKDSINLPVLKKPLVPCPATRAPSRPTNPPEEMA